jgi:hypothetical protein
MKRPLPAALALVACVAAVTVSAVHVSAQRARPEAVMADAAKQFLATLTPEQRAKATFAFKDEERQNWHFIPKPRKGLPLKDMTETQRGAALALLQASLSKEGSDTAATIRGLEKVLKVQENGSAVRDPENYYFSVFGDPSDTGNWGWRYEGHHCSQNWTVAAGKAVASTPQFFGSNPAEVREDVPGAPPKGTRALKDEEDLGLELVKSLTDDQKKEAILSDAVPGDIITGPARQAMILKDEGLPVTKLTQEQQGIIRRLVHAYADKQPAELARQRLAAIRTAGYDSIKFAWIGPTERNQKCYYRIQGKTFLIEYDNTSGNHIHSVWRDFKGDFGMDLLAMHYQAYPHRVAQAH